ncbi:MAG: serine protease [Ardenticatenaceae bacterium]|nr:serine protease [Ardenticatenaceae bacterium]
MEDQNDFSHLSSADQMNAEMNHMLMPDTNLIKKSPGTLSIVGEEPSGEDVLEAILGENDIVDHGIIAGLIDVGRSVARIRAPGHESLAVTEPDQLSDVWDQLNRDQSLKGFVGTGWVFGSARKLLMTNNHVIPVPQAAVRARIEFGYVRNARTDSTSKSHIMRLNPGEVFFSSPTMRFGGLDYALIALSDEADEVLGYLDYAPGNTALHTEVVYVVQHPGGAPKAYVVNHNKKINLTEQYFTYTSDTKGGSSGSPLFDESLNLIGIHHVGNHRVRVGRRRIFTNLGSRMELVIDDLLKQMEQSGWDTDKVKTWFGESYILERWLAK